MACCGQDPVSTQTAPLLIGEPAGATAVQVTVISPFGNLVYGDRAWVTGSLVQPFIDAGNLVPVGSDGDPTSMTPADVPADTTGAPDGKPQAARSARRDTVDAGSTP